jgi:hypothetical protein
MKATRRSETTRPTLEEMVARRRERKQGGRDGNIIEQSDAGYAESTVATGRIR